MSGDPFTDNEYEPPELWPGGIRCAGCGLRGVDVCGPCEETAQREWDAWAAAENARMSDPRERVKSC